MWIQINLIVDCKKISVFSGRNHSHISYLLGEGYQSGFILLEIKVDVNKYFALNFWMWKFKLLFIPALANPTYITIEMTTHRIMFPGSCYLETIDLECIYWMQKCSLSLSKYEKTSRVYKTIISSEMKTDESFVRLEFSRNQLGGLLTEIVET